MPPIPPYQAMEANSIAAANLTRLLSRLESKLETPPKTSLEHAKLAANLDYARQLLHKIESSTAMITVPAKKQKVMVELGAQKQTIRRLNESLHAAASQAKDFGGMDEDEDSSGNSDNEVEEDHDDDDYERLARAAKRKPVPGVASPDADSAPAQKPAALEPTSTLRNRFSAATKDKKKHELFGKAAEDHTNRGAEQILDDQRRQQEDITNELLNMAQKLKESSLNISKNLEDEKGYLDLAKEGLDRNAMGLDATGRRLEALRKNDNVSYMKGMIYLVQIILLALANVAVLFFAPKLRWW